KRAPPRPVPPQSVGSPRWRAGLRSAGTQAGRRRCGMPRRRVPAIASTCRSRRASSTAKYAPTIKHKGHKGYRGHQGKTRKEFPFVSFVSFVLTQKTYMTDTSIKDFEGAIAELESIVKKLEEGDLALEQSLA